MPKLYHGTELKSIPAILKDGLEEAEGWGGAGTVGVFLSGTPEGALYWAKLAYMRFNDERMESHIFDRDHGHHADDLIAVLVVDVPEPAEDDLKADQEQYEDVMADFSPDDWRQSLKEIGDVRFNGPIPPQWIVDVLHPSDIEDPHE